MKVERRTYPATELRVERRDDGKPVIRGYSAVFNRLSEELWGFYERILPGAFSSAIATDDVRALFNHDSNLVLGRTAAKTLMLREDDSGLLMEATPPDTQNARDVVTLIERGDVTGQSFSFMLDYEDDGAESWDYENGQVVRTIKKISRLWDVGPVTFPAYPDTDVSVGQRSAAPDLVIARAAEFRKSIAGGRDVELARQSLKLIRVDC